MFTTNSLQKSNRQSGNRFATNNARGLYHAILKRKSPRFRCGAREGKRPREFWRAKPSRPKREWPNLRSFCRDHKLNNKGRVLAWADERRLAIENALASVGIASLNLFSGAYFEPDTFRSAAARKESTRSCSLSENFASDAKDLPGELMASPTDRIYY